MHLSRFLIVHGGDVAEHEDVGRLYCFLAAAGAAALFVRIAGFAGGGGGFTNQPSLR